MFLTVVVSVHIQKGFLNLMIMLIMNNIKNNHSQGVHSHNANWCFRCGQERIIPAQHWHLSGSHNLPTF